MIIIIHFWFMFVIVLEIIPVIWGLKLAFSPSFHLKKKKTALDDLVAASDWSLYIIKVYLAVLKCLQPLQINEAG